MVKVMAFVDGFNLYHALEKFERGKDEADKLRFQKYKWLCVKSLIKIFIRSNEEELIRVRYFTTWPTWDEAKRLRHLTYVNALKQTGVEVILGEFKPKTVECRAFCYKEFALYQEKQTDVNIAIKMIASASVYDKLILLTADSDQVPALKLIKQVHPDKTLAVLPPIARGSKELSAVTDQSFAMTEDHLRACQLPNPFPIVKDGKETGRLNKPVNWP
jgi:uncharacterized LabA/DUF88 family protein